MEITISNKDGNKHVIVNGVDFDTMTEDFRLSLIYKLINKTDLKTTFLSLIKEKDFDMMQTKDEHGIVTVLKEKKINDNE